MRNVESIIDEVIQEYSNKVKGLWDTTKGGKIRSIKGPLVESITKDLVKAAWINIGGDPLRLALLPNGKKGMRKKMKVPINMNNISTFPSALREEISANPSAFFYNISVDVHVFIDNVFVLGIESKTYAENAMLKRILIDFFFLKEQYPDLKCCLIQLETWLGGNNNHPHIPLSIGNKSTYTLMSYFPTVDLQIITLLEGARDIKKPIHEQQWYKQMKPDYIKIAVDNLSKLLADFV